MNEDTVLDQLRDIHVPPDAVDAVPPMALAWWPFLVLAIVIAVPLALRMWRGSQWRRHARAELSRIVGVKDPGEQWPLLLAFAASLSGRARRAVNLPPVAYRHPDTVSASERGEFIVFLGRELER